MDLTNTTNPNYSSDPMPVRRVEHAGGSHIEPPLDESWTDFHKLVWLAGVVEEDSGLRIRVTEWTHPGRFSISGETPGRSWSRGGGTFAETWRTMSDLSMGAQIARDHEANKEES